jgi:hypothetical protein
MISSVRTGRKQTFACLQFEPVASTVRRMHVHRHADPSTLVQDLL